MPKDTQPVGSTGALQALFTPSHLCEFGALSRAACQSSTTTPHPWAIATLQCPLTSGPLGLHTCPVLLGSRGQLSLGGQCSGQGQQPRGTATHQPRWARGEGHRGGVVGQRLELLLLERSRGGPGAGGGVGCPVVPLAQEATESGDRVYPGELPTQHPQLRHLLMRGSGSGVSPGQGRGQETHPNEAVQLPHSHLLGTLHGLQHLLLMLGGGGYGKWGAQENPFTPSGGLGAPICQGSALWGPHSSPTLILAPALGISLLPVSPFPLNSMKKKRNKAYKCS